MFVNLQQGLLLMVSSFNFCLSALNSYHLFYVASVVDVQLLICVHHAQGARKLITLLYWQRMWTAVTCPSCFPITAANEESPPTVKMKDGRGQILCSSWWCLYRMLIYNLAAELLRPEVGKTIWRHNIHINIFIRPTVCVYFKESVVHGRNAHLHTPHH